MSFCGLHIEGSTALKENFADCARAHWFTGSTCAAIAAAAWHAF